MKILTLNPSTATHLTATHLTATHLTATHLTATHLTATHLTVWLLLWTALFNLAIPTSSHAQSAEICTNGIDDDGDTLIDCEDDDCTFPLFSDNTYGNSESSNVGLGDLDGDGDLDAWVANVNNQANRVWINDGLGNYTDSRQVLDNTLGNR